ncbi:MAG: hypothetical protein ACE5EC_02355 [Phycisphaerae bacterium]
MALRVKCKCGRSLKISSKLADKRLACPACKHPFRIPTAKFKAAAIRSAATHTPPRQSATRKARAATPPPVPAAPPDPAPANLDNELLGDLSGAFDHSQSDILTELDLDATQAEAAVVPKAVAVDAHSAVALGYARDRMPTVPSKSRLADPIQGPTRGFWADAFFSFIYPVRTGGNAVTCIIILVMSAMLVLLDFAGTIGFAGQCIIFGWLASLYFAIVSETAAGSDDLPNLSLEGGFLDGVIKPAFKYIGAYAIVLAPGLILGICIGLGAVPPSLGIMIPIWLAAGIFLLPIVLLLFSFEAIAMVFRIDLIFSTIFRTFLPYLAIWLMLTLANLITISSFIGALLVKMGMPSLFPNLTWTGLTLNLVVTVLDTYMTIVMMRIIGLYYLHFKKRFTIVME